MKTIDKFILRSYFGPMILTFFIVMFVLLMNFLWRYIDELVGKGLELSVIGELMLYVSITLVQMGLPLATLLGAIMTMGNLGENYELLAMKSSGMSLPRIMRPLIIVIALISVGSFFVANNLSPWANRQMSALLYDIKQQKQTIEFQDGQFFTGIDDMTVRVGRQDPGSGLLRDVLIYDNSKPGGNMTTTVADSGYIHLSDDKKFLVVTLFNGENLEHTRDSRNWYNESKLSRNYFDEQNGLMAMSGFDFSRTDSDLFSSGQTKNLMELERGIDSLSTELAKLQSEIFQPFMSSLFPNDNTLYVDSLKKSNARIYPVGVEDSISFMGERERQKIWPAALSTARASKNSFTWDEERAKDTLNQLLRYKVEWHRKWSLPVSIMIFFLIGAPLGAIIRKGGLGMPIVVSVLFFVIYYIISITGEKLAREGTWSAVGGMWLSSFILLPIAIFLVYKATNDSNLFNAEWYINLFKKIKNFFLSILDRKTVRI
ncbi:MAG: LptF/LptG family permease [Alistipes sp.]|nr:LptF/LptG family permease [Alistipes sp.]